LSHRERDREGGEIGAGERVRTVDLYLGKVSLYQLSYTRLPISTFKRNFVKKFR
jgi:hypothetical protein